MHDSAANILLDTVCSRLREARPRIEPSLDVALRREVVPRGPFVYLWFRTRGCRYDARGGCTMCNYGVSSPASEEQMVAAVRRGLARVDPEDNALLLISPSGSMFDDWEVPRRARDRIFQLARSVKTRGVLCETRADNLTERGVASFKDVFDDRQPGIGLGLESADPVVLKYCVNKAMRLPDYVSAVGLLRRHGVTSATNVLLGAPLLTESEAIDDAVASIRWAFARGSDECVLLPVHVKSFTFVEWLWRRGAYSPPSLWSLVEVLSRLGPGLAERVNISWYKAYEGDLLLSEIIASPTTCPGCEAAVLTALDAYRATGDVALLQQLEGFDCSCHQEWRSRLDRPAPSPLLHRIELVYETAARDILGDAWWHDHRANVLREARALASTCAHPA